MSLIEFTHGKFIKAINTANNTSLTINDFVFSNPRVNTSGISVPTLPLCLS